MKAAVFKELGEPLAVVDIADPTPAGTQVVLQVGRCGICGSDLHVTEEPDFLAPPGKVLGHEYAGEVVAVGPAVERIRVGDHAAVLPLSACGRCAACLAGDPAGCDQRAVEGGGYAEYAMTEERQCVVLPKTLSMADGALVEPMAVGLHGVAESGLRPGDRVLVIGAGPIGLAVIYWASRMGAGMVAATARSDRRAGLAQTMGADKWVSGGDDPVAAATDAMSGAPDIVFECVGRPGVLGQAVATVRRRGTVVVLGLCFSRDTWIPFVGVSKEVLIRNAAFYSLREFTHAAEPFNAGDVTPHAMVTDEVSLADMPPVFEALRNRTTQCKVLVKP